MTSGLSLSEIGTGAGSGEIVAGGGADCDCCCWRDALAGVDWGVSLDDVRVVAAAVVVDGDGSVAGGTMVAPPGTIARCFSTGVTGEYGGRSGVPCRSPL